MHKWVGGDEREKAYVKSEATERGMEWRGWEGEEKKKWELI